MDQSRRQFTDEFKREAATLLASSGRRRRRPQGGWASTYIPTGEGWLYLVRRRRVDTALLGHLRQHFVIGSAIVPAHDRAQRGIGLHRRGIDADPLALDQALLGHKL
jgi:hypothetical protein